MARDEIREFFFREGVIRFEITGRGRNEIPEIPEEALREAVVNAIAHRDYRSPANIQICIFQDRVEIVSPGGLPAGMTPELLGKKSVPRNPLLFGILYRMDAVEHIGSGIKRIRDICEETDTPVPEIEVDEDWVTVRFFRAPDTTTGGVNEGVTEQDGGVSEGLNEGLSEGLNRLAQHILEHPGQRLPMIADQLEIPAKTVERWLRKLRRLNRIEFRGAKRSGGYWPKDGSE